MYVVRTIYTIECMYEFGKHFKFVRAVNTIRVLVLALSNSASRVLVNSHHAVFRPSQAHHTTLFHLSRGQALSLAAAVVRCSQFNGEPQLLMWRTLNLTNAHSNVTRAYLRYIVVMVPLLGGVG